MSEPPDHQIKPKRRQILGSVTVQSTQLCETGTEGAWRLDSPELGKALLYADFMWWRSVTANRNYLNSHGNGGKDLWESFQYNGGDLSSRSLASQFSVTRLYWVIKTRAMYMEAPSTAYTSGDICSVIVEHGKCVSITATQCLLLLCLCMCEHKQPAHENPFSHFVDLSPWSHTLSSTSIQFIYMAPKHTQENHFKALCIARSRPFGSRSQVKSYLQTKVVLLIVNLVQCSLSVTHANITYVKDLKTSELLHLWQQLRPNQQGTIHHHLAEHQELKTEAATSPMAANWPVRAWGYSPVKPENHIISKKHKDAILRSPNQYKPVKRVIP